MYVVGVAMIVFVTDTTTECQHRLIDPVALQFSVDPFSAGQHKIEAKRETVDV